ncbi:MAG: hypothetical protein A3K03_09645, partial [Bdellovibrionales bacterium RIFOXYD1_FULL_44_7]
DPNVIENLGDNIIVIPIWSIEELDRAKNRLDLVGASSREFSRQLDSYQEMGSLKEGVATKSGGRLFVDYNGKDWTDLPVGLEHNNDNRMLLVAMAWQNKPHKPEVIILSKDLNLRIKANACGLKADDYQHDKRITRIEELYSGRVTINLTGDQAEILNILSRDKSLAAKTVAEILGVCLAELPANIGCKFVCGGKYVLAVYKPLSKVFVSVSKPKSLDKSKGIEPINDEQALAFKLLMDPEIKLVTLVGKAGTGKTLISLLAAYRQTGEEGDDKPSRILVWRPNVEIGRSLGFLPGDIDEKFAPWREPICENMRLIVGHSQEKDGRKFDIVGELIRSGYLEIQPINYALGATKHNAIILIDEAQNLTPREVAALITRCGEYSKVIITGDPYQIYNPYLDPASNGLTYVVERFRGQDIFGHITMVKSERSKLAELAADIL